MDYNPIASDYDKDIANDLSEEKLLFELVTLANITNPKGWHILDVGCGSGIQDRFLANRFPGIEKIVGIDNSEALIDLARSHNKDERCEYLLADMHHIPLEDNAIDFIYSRYALHYSNDLSSIMKQLYRVGKPGCQAFIQVVHPIYELFRKPSRDYEQHEEADFTPQTTTVRVEHVTHKISEYINSSIEAKWGILDIEERFGGQSSVEGFHLPTVFILRLKKR